MTTSYAESVPSLTSKSSKYHVYQTDGKPLSSEAIYRAKLKYGIYNNPARVNLGVDPSASDTAAVLAANTDLSIHGYSKDLSSEATHAALIAKPDSITAYKRSSVAPEAEYAAISAKSLKFPFNSSSASLDEYEHQSEGAAASVLKRPSRFVARDALQDIYDFDDIRSGKATLSQFSSVPTSKSAKSLSNKKDYRSGIATSNNAAETSRKMNIGNISKAATRSASQTLNSRLTPEKDFRSGIKTSSAKVSSRTSTLNNSSFYINNVLNQAIEASSKELSKKTTRSLGIQTPSDLGLEVNPANFASSALKTDLSNTDLVAAERATLKNNTLVDQGLYAIASQKVDKQIQKMDGEVAALNIFSNVKINQAAYQLAQENAKKRKEKELGPGQIALGGGLRMNYLEVEKIASTLVKPAISDMEERIVEMKAINQEKQNLPVKIRQRNLELQEEKRQAQLALEKKRAEEAKARRDQLALDKQAYDEEHEKIKAELEEEYQAKEEEFNEQVEEENAQKKVIDDEREAKLKVLNDAKSGKDTERQGELDDLQKERDDDVAPLLAELEEETKKLDELTANREEKEAFFNEEKSKTDAIQADLDDTLSKIEIMNQRIAELEAGLSEVTDQEAAETSAALEAETKLSTEGKEEENNLDSLATERADLENKRAALHEENAAKADEIKNLAKENHEEEKEINDIYPEHLRKEVIEPEDFDDEDLNDSKFELDDEPIEIPPEVESEPEDVPEEVWPKVEQPEPESEDDDEEAVEGSAAEAGGIATSKTEPRKIVRKKNWEEIKAAGVPEDGDPLVNVPTEEKPAMVDIVDDDKVRASVTAANELRKKKSTVTSSATPAAKATAAVTATAPASATKTTAAAKATPASGGATRNVPVIKSDKTGKGLFGFFKSSKAEKEFVAKTEVVNPEEAKKKFKGLQSSSSAKDTNNEDDDVFSGFSQGSEVEA